MSFEISAIKSLEANRSYLRKGSDVFDRDKLGPARSNLNWTGRTVREGEKAYRLATETEWPPVMQKILNWFA